MSLDILPACGAGLAKLEPSEMKRIERERRREVNRKKGERDIIREDLTKVWLEYLNGKSHEAFIENIIDYIIKIKKERL